MSFKVINWPKVRPRKWMIGCDQSGLISLSTIKKRWGNHPIFIMRGPLERSTDIYTTVRLKTGSSETSGSGEVFDLKLRRKSRILVTLDPQQYSEWFLDVINNLPTCLIGLLVQNLKQLKRGLSNGGTSLGLHTISNIQPEPKQILSWRVSKAKIFI